MRTFTDADLTTIAQALSGEHGTFPVENLVNYGSTVVIRPGARTSHGVVMGGAEVCQRLNGDYVAFPLAVEYMAEPDGDFEAQLGGLEADVMGARPGGSALRLRGRYARVTERFRHRLAQLRRSGRPAFRFRANRALARLGMIWQRMGALRLNRAGLVPPSQLRAELQGLRAIPGALLRPASPVSSVATSLPQTSPFAPSPVAPVYAPAWVSAPAPSVTLPSTYVPASRQVSQYYHADQAALEREIAEGAPSYYGATDYAVGQEELGADLRAETIGYLFGGAEHDYWGMSADEDIEFTSEDFRDLLKADIGDELADFAYDESIGSAVSIERLDDVLAGARMLAVARRHALVNPERARRLRKGALAMKNKASLAKLGLDEEIEEADAEIEEAKAASKPVASDPAVAKAANLQRRVLIPSASELRSVAEGKGGLEKVARASVLLTQITDALRSVSPSGSVNYARLRPRSFGSATPVVTVIGIQKGTGAPDSALDVLFEEEVPRFPVGYDVPDAVTAITRYTSVSDYSGSMNLLLALVPDTESDDAFGADVAEMAKAWVKRTIYLVRSKTENLPATDGWTKGLTGSALALGEAVTEWVIANVVEPAEGWSPEAAILVSAALKKDAIEGKLNAAKPEDRSKVVVAINRVLGMRGSASRVAWPDGGGAPLPPPRKLGSEVYGG
jgi:hypothetical protein